MAMNNPNRFLAGLSDISQIKEGVRDDPVTVYVKPTKPVAVMQASTNLETGSLELEELKDKLNVGKIAD